MANEEAKKSIDTYVGGWAPYRYLAVFNCSVEMSIL